MSGLVKTLAIPVRFAEKIPGIGWLIRGLSTSIGQKLVMAVTGLLLCGFLVAHLAGNLLLFVGMEKYNSYAHALHDNEGLLLIAELGLVALFFTHIALAISTSSMNREARKRDYAEKETKQGMTVLPGGGASSYMFATGAVVLGFVLLHLADFTFRLSHGADFYAQFDGNEFAKAKALLSNPISALVYVVGCVALGVHLVHGFQSALMTLGFGHPKYKTAIRAVSVAFGWAISLGFISFVLWSFGAKDPVPSTDRPESAQTEPVAEKH